MGLDAFQADLEGRRFQLWEFWAEHGALLIRSPASSLSSKNMDIICVGLKHLSAPLRLGNIRIAEPEGAEVDRLSADLGEVIQPSMVLILISEGRRFSVVASRFVFEENSLGIFEHHCDMFAEVCQSERYSALPASAACAVENSQRGASSGSRRFHLWELKVSLGSLLIRSPADSLHLHNLDLFLMGLDYYSGPILFENLEVEAPTDEEISRMELALGAAIQEPSKVMIMATGGRRFPIVASFLRREENDRQLFVRRFDIGTYG